VVYDQYLQGNITDSAIFRILLSGTCVENAVGPIRPDYKYNGIIDLHWLSERIEILERLAQRNKTMAEFIFLRFRYNFRVELLHKECSLQLYKMLHDCFYRRITNNILNFWKNPTQNYYYLVGTAILRDGELVSFLLHDLMIECMFHKETDIDLTFKRFMREIKLRTDDYNPETVGGRDYATDFATYADTCRESIENNALGSLQNLWAYANVLAIENEVYEDRSVLNERLRVLDTGLGILFEYIDTHKDDPEKSSNVCENMVKAIVQSAWDRNIVTIRNLLEFSNIDRADYLVKK
jgi:hypothetical protein